MNVHIKKRHKFPFARFRHKLKHHFQVARTHFSLPFTTLAGLVFFPKHSTIIVLLSVHYNFLFRALSLFRVNVIMLPRALKWLLSVFESVFDSNSILLSIFSLHLVHTDIWWIELNRTEYKFAFNWFSLQLEFTSLVCHTLLTGLIRALVRVCASNVISVN